MTKALLASVIKESGETTAVVATKATNDLIDAIVEEIKKNGKFNLHSFGTFKVRELIAQKGVNPRTGDRLELGVRKTVRFKPSPTLKKML